MQRIVVGVDGSDESRNALAWAAEEAKLRQAELEVVYAYEYTPAWQLYGYEGVSVAQMDAIAAEDEAAQERAQELAGELVHQMVHDLGPVDGVKVTPVAITDRRAAAALVARSEGADMLVVGSRGRGGFSGLLLGSVSQQCAAHAHCPVTIISPKVAPVS